MTRRLRLMTKLIRFWPPYLAAGIVSRRLADGSFEARMRLLPWNRNLFGTHFGGSLYSMCDPFFVLILVERLGPAYAVWDKAATIRFRRPGLGLVRARFAITPEQVAALRERADREGRAEGAFTTAILDAAGAVIAEVDKLVQVKRRDAVAGAPSPPLSR
jgi:acyl-coenzyme A thioesterase PaaI-like protein